MSDKKQSQGSASAIREALQNENRRKIDVTVLGLPAQLWSLTAFEAQHYRTLLNSDKPEERASAPAKLVQMSLRSPQGEMVYGKDDLAIVAGRQDRTLMPLYYQALELNGMAPESWRELAKNLLMIAGDSGSSGSPESTGAASPSCSDDTASTSFRSSTSPSASGPAVKPATI